MAPSCGNFHYLQCLKDLYSKFSLYQILDLDEAGQEMFACMKKCHGEICKVYNVKDDWKIAWNCDRKEGDDDLNNSDNLLTKWVTTEGNYSKFCNRKTGMGGSRKKDVWNQIADMINHISMRKICTGKQVQLKIEHVEKSFQKVYKFSFTETGQGLMEQSEGIFCEAIFKICPHYYDLFDVMKDGSSSKPQINLEELNEIIAKPLSSDDDDDSLIGNENVIQPDNQNDDNTETKDNSHPNSQASNNTTVEVVLTTTTPDVVPVTTPLVMKWKKDNKRRSTASSKKCCKSRDDVDIDTFLKYQKEASSLKKASIKESQQHNKEMRN